MGRPDAEPVLRNIEPDEYARCGDVLAGPPARRAAHFFSEMQRVRAGVDCWRRGDLAEFGRLISASGESSIRNYECGCPPLVDLFEILDLHATACSGARFSGAGFTPVLSSPGSLPAQQSRPPLSSSTSITKRPPQVAEQATVFMGRTDAGHGSWPTRRLPVSLERPSPSLGGARASRKSTWIV